MVFAGKLHNWKNKFSVQYHFVKDVGPAHRRKLPKNQFKLHSILVNKSKGAAQLLLIVKCNCKS